MKRSRFTEERIIVLLRERESGVKTADVCREHGISGVTFYKLKSKYGGLGVSEARRPKVLEDENAKLKRLRGSGQSWFGRTPSQHLVQTTPATISRPTE